MVREGHADATSMLPRQWIPALRAVLRRRPAVNSEKGGRVVCCQRAPRRRPEPQLPDTGISVKMMMRTSAGLQIRFWGPFARSSAHHFCAGRRSCPTLGLETTHPGSCRQGDATVQPDLKYFITAGTKAMNERRSTAYAARPAGTRAGWGRFCPGCGLRAVPDLPATSAVV